MPTRHSERPQRVRRGGVTNSSPTKIRAIGEWTNAPLESWRLLWKLRCTTIRITAIIKAVLVRYLAAA